MFLIDWPRLKRKRPANTSLLRRITNLSRWYIGSGGQMFNGMTTGISEWESRFREVAEQSGRSARGARA
jgi:hypothetical protein